MRKVIPKENDIRHIVRFAWRPVIIGQVKIWWEKYAVIQKYSKSYRGAEGYWEDHELVLTENLPARLERLFNNRY
jgi:hypothetical protein